MAEDSRSEFGAPDLRGSPPTDAAFLRKTPPPPGPTGAPSPDSKAGIGGPAQGAGVGGHDEQASQNPPTGDHPGNSLDAAHAAGAVLAAGIAPAADALHGATVVDTIYGQSGADWLEPASASTDPQAGWDASDALTLAVMLDGSAPIASTHAEAVLSWDGNAGEAEALLMADFSDAPDLSTADFII